MPRPVGLKDVALDAGVSVAAVSQALNGKGRLAPATRNRILDAAERLGYRPNPGASALVLGRSQVLALSMPEIEHFPELAGEVRHFLGVLGGAAGAALELDHALVVAPGGVDSPAWNRVLFDGAIVVDPVEDEPVLAALGARGIPIVTIGHAMGDDAVPHVDNDIAAMTRTALDRLAAGGDKDIMLMYAQPRQSIEADTERAYRAWCERHDVAPSIVVARNPGPDAIATAAAKALDARPRAIYATFDKLSAAVATEALHRSIAIPDELQLVTFSDSDVARAHDLTTIDERPSELGAAAVRLLVGVLAAEQSSTVAPSEPPVQGVLVERGSTRPVAAAAPPPA
ncbi:LacI family DNA-binding transcriptional regulator [Conexibacter woesei]|uniref:LacI family DNA-binding transcriptional regulator n=1 Tax=Conexibacter woesei TaxID=191495 RepID=UPI00040D7D54|nr:LacI family DNA-binding transcriptional regulator [Conexibacter woesei]